MITLHTKPWGHSPSDCQHGGCTDCRQREDHWEMLLERAHRHLVYWVDKFGMDDIRATMESKQVIDSIARRLRFQAVAKGGRP